VDFFSPVRLIMITVNPGVLKLCRSMCCK